MSLPSKEHLDECFIYQDSGVLVWKIRPREHFKSDQNWKAWNTKWSNKIAGHRGKRGYLITSLNSKTFYLHRIIWKMIRSEEPEFLDHRNGIKIDNRIENLRSATKNQNCQNTKKRSDNTSGFKGVIYRKEQKRWRAVIYVNKKRIILGQFKTPEEAGEAYLKAAKQLHGEFMREC